MTALQDQVHRDPLAKHSLSPAELKALVAAEREDEAFLVFRDEQRALHVYKLTSGAQTHSVGRRAEMDLSIPSDREVSGLHAEVQCLGGEWTVVDDGLSTNGTFVNGRRISGRQRLRDQDRIRMGQTTFAYRTAEAIQPEATVAGADRPQLELSGTQRRVLVALCRPLQEGDSAAIPATNQQIAEEVFLSVDTVKTNLRALFAKFELGDLPQYEKRVRLADCALQLGVISPRELA